MGKFTTSAMAGAPAQAIRIDTQVGRVITEIGSDGNETHWGKITEYDPFGRVAMDFHIPTPDYKVGPMSRVVVTFEDVGAERTRVQLTHTNFAVFGEMAKGVFGGYSHGWEMIFVGAFKAACGG